MKDAHRQCLRDMMRWRHLRHRFAADLGGGPSSKGACFLNRLFLSQECPGEPGHLLEMDRQRRRHWLARGVKCGALAAGPRLGKPIVLTDSADMKQGNGNTKKGSPGHKGGKNGKSESGDGLIVFVNLQGIATYLGTEK